MTAETIGLEAHYELFLELSELLGSPPLLIDSNLLTINPEPYLQKICKNFEIPFSSKMLNWGELNPKSQINWEKNKAFYTNAAESSGFFREKSEVTFFPSDLSKLLEQSLKIYEKFVPHIMRIN